jgi:hypothetical protein
MCGQTILTLEWEKTEKDKWVCFLGSLSALVFGELPVGALNVVHSTPRDDSEQSKKMERRKLYVTTNQVSHFNCHWLCIRNHRKTEGKPRNFTCLPFFYDKKSKLEKCRNLTEIC